jgi:RHS repeat-associated protein
MIRTLREVGCKRRGWLMVGCPPLALCVGLSALALLSAALPAAAQDLNAVIRGVSIAFANEGADAVVRGVSVSFAWQGGDAASRGVSIRFAEEGGDARTRGVSLSFAQEGGNARTRGVSLVFKEATDSASGRGVSIAFESAPPAPASLLGKPRNAAMNADPVNTATGNYVFDHTDLAMPGPGLGFEFTRFYNSLDDRSGPLGIGWTHSLALGLVEDVSAGTVSVRWGDGHVDTYLSQNGSYLAQLPGLVDSLSKNGDGTFVVRKKDQREFRFGADGRLTAIADRNGNAQSLTYAGAKLASVTDTAGRVITFTYDASDRIIQVSDPLPRTVSFGYDAAGHLTSVTDPNGGIEGYTYDANHQLLTATDPRGNTYLTNTYDSARRVVTWQSDAKGNQYQFSYDEATGQTTITDPLGNVSVDAYDARKRLVRQTDRLGHSVSYTYDDQNNRTTITDKNGKTTTYYYSGDGLGNVTGKMGPAPFYYTTSITYDSRNNPLSRRDEAGGLTQFSYDSNGNLLTTTDARSGATSFAYDARGQVVTVTDANGHVTTNEYDEAGNPVSVTDAAGKKTSFTYDAAGRRLSATDARGNRTEFSYDPAGHLLQTLDAAGGLVVNQYDANGNRTRVTDARGGVTAFTFDENNLLTTVTDGLGGVTTHTYDKLDRKVSTRDARGNLVRFTYDEEGRLLTTTDATGGVTRMSYDGVGNTLSVTDPLNRVTGFTYDPLTRLTETKDPLQHTDSRTYDPLGRVQTTTDAKGRTTTFAYDELGRLTQVTDPNGGTAKYTYDPVGNRLTVTDPNGKQTTSTYDVVNRLLTATDPLDNRTSYAYDAVGNKASATDANGVTVTYAYDALNRLSEIHEPTGPGVAFAYDAAGNRTQMVDAVGTTAYTYDALNRLTQFVDAFGKTIGYEYDAVGNRTALVYPDGKRVAYGFDAANRLTTVTDWADRVTQYACDAAGQLTGTTNANGTMAAYGYDAAGRLTALANRKGDGSVIASYSYTLDPAGNRTGVDQVEPLVAPPAPTQQAYTYNAANQIQAAGAAAFTSDKNGNLTSRIEPSGTTTYAYDAHDRLTAVGAAGASAYTYDGVGTRVARNVNGTVRRFVVDPQPTLSQVLMETDATGTPLARYVYGVGLVARVNPAGDVLTYHFDPRGSTVAMTDAAQAAVNTYAYDEFGAVRAKQEAVAQPFQYVGQFGVMQEANGLQFMRARYYAPADGRFLNVDPSPTINTPQDLNLYVYGRNNSVRWLDFTGLNPVSALFDLADPFMEVERDYRTNGGKSNRQAAIDRVMADLDAGRDISDADVYAFYGGAGREAQQKGLAVAKAGIDLITDASGIAVPGDALDYAAGAATLVTGETPQALELAQQVRDWWNAGWSAGSFIARWFLGGDNSGPALSARSGGSRTVRVTLPEQREVQRPVSSTGKKAKRDTSGGGSQ